MMRAAALVASPHGLENTTRYSPVSPYSARVSTCTAGSPCVGDGNTPDAPVMGTPSFTHWKVTSR